MTRLSSHYLFFFGDLMYSDGPTADAQVDSGKYNSELLGENELGSVHIHGPFGNQDSEIRIAYLLGMHPLESKSHRALFEKLTNHSNLNCSYYIYNINVSKISTQTEGRMEGQLLAQEFVRDDIIDKYYDLFLDIHSNRGSFGPGSYEITNFVFAPGFDEKSTGFVEDILENIEELAYYAPEYRTSPSFITEPTAKAGIATIVYECWTYEPMEYTCELAEKLIGTVDRLLI